MKKVFNLFLCVVLFVGLSGCGKEQTILRYTEQCLNGIEVDSNFQQVYVMEYTLKKELADQVLTTDMYDSIPGQGIAVLYHPISSGHGDYVFFFDSNGKLVFSFDYEESYALYEENYRKFSPNNIRSGEIALMHLENCNYISGMRRYAHDSCEELKSKVEKNTWYELNDKQLAKIFS